MPAAAPAGEALRALADALIDDGAAPPAGLPDEERLALAWRLKDACYAAWSTEPPRAERAAAALARLRDHGAAPARSAGSDAKAGPTGTQAASLDALAAWTEGIAHLVRGDLGAAADALDRAAASWHRAAQPLPAAQCQVPKVMALCLAGHFAQAEACGLATQQALLAAGDTLGAAKVGLNLGSVAMQRARFQDALPHYRGAAVHFAWAGNREHSIMADIGLADAHRLLARFDRAEALYERARLRAVRHGLPALAAAAGEGAASLALARGRIAEALARLEACRQAYEALGLPQGATEVEKVLADAYLETRLLPEALALYDRVVGALDVQQAGATRPWALTQKARALALAGAPEAALVTLGQAEAAFDEADTVGRATVAQARAELHLAQGDAAAAAPRAAEARALFEHAGLATGAAAARALQAASAVRLGDAADALPSIEALLAEDTLPPPLRVQLRVQRALAWRALGRHADACAELEAAIEAFEDVRAALPGDDLRRAFLIDGMRPYRERLRYALEAAEPGAPPDPPARAAPPGERPGHGRAPSRPHDAAAAVVLGWLDRWKTGQQSERLGARARGAAHAPGGSEDDGVAAADDDGTDGRALGAGALSPQAGPDLLGRQAGPEATGPEVAADAPELGAGPDAPVAVLRSRLDALYRHEAQLVEQDRAPPPELGAAMRQLERELLERVRRARLAEAARATAHDFQTPHSPHAPDPTITPTSPAVASARDAPHPGPAGLDVPALQRALGPARALVAYGVLDDELFAVVVRAGGVHLMRRLASWAATERAVESLRFQLEAPRAGEAAMAAHRERLASRTQQRLAQLHGLVWSALVPWLDGASEVVVVPHGALHGVPFAALGPGQDGLLDRHAVWLAGSTAAALSGLRAATLAPRDALLLGDTGRLPHVAGELDAVARALAPLRVQRNEGLAARAAAVREAAGQADVLHLACHGRFRPDNPLYSALQLQDGVLTAADVEALTLRPGLVVLSACETALGDTTGAGDENVGLVRAFLRAGAARVLGSHWAVDDEATATLMHGFYGGWRAGLPAAEALRQAQLALRRERPHPYHWAAFSLHGGG